MDAIPVYERFGMKIILNFLPLKTGGGVQVALDFLNQAEVYGQEHEWHLVAREGTPFEDFRYAHYIKTVTFVRDNIFSRLKFEYLSCLALIRKVSPDVIYTQFGPHWPAARGVNNVVGCAYSNLFYPEIDFWANYSLLKRIERRCFDYYRKYQLKKANVVIFETSDLKNRAIEQKVLKADQCTFVLPAVSSNVSVGVTHLKTRGILSAAPRGFRLCLISGYSINKNFEILVEVLATLKQKYDKHDVYFVLTLPEDSPYVKALFHRAISLAVKNNIINLGAIPFDACAEVYRACDAAILPATLESFSNNIAESWAMEKPLMISDMDWSRSLCGDGAIYIDQTCAESIAKSIIELIDSPSMAGDLVNYGKLQLKKYPDSKGRFLGYMDIIDKVVNKGG